MAETIAKSNLNMVCVDASEHSKRAMDCKYIEDYMNCL